MVALLVSGVVTIDGIGFTTGPRGMLVGKIPGMAPVARWQRLLVACRGTKRYPVLVETSADLAMSANAEPVAKILAKVTQVNLSRERRKWRADQYAPEEPDGLARFTAKAPARTRPPVPPRYPKLFVESQKPTSFVVALLPVAEGWKAPAYLGFGSYNACPPPEVHCAMLQRWDRAYGARPVSFGGDTIEVFLPRPLSDPKSLKDLAEQQALYCPDIVDQGTGDATVLARSLAHAPIWFLWWD